MLYSMNKCFHATRTYAKSARQTTKCERRVEYGELYLVFTLANEQNSINLGDI